MAPTVHRPFADLDRAARLSLLRGMLRVRRAEERLAQDFRSGSLPGPVHLYIGQEAVAVGTCAQLGDDDWITSTHRGHGHFIAKGGDLDAMFAEIYGRATGICGGMGGSMHVADLDRGMLGANGIVGGGIGIATGAALNCQLDGKGRVAVCFFGDGASSQGVLSEALNLAQLWKLPIVFVCENNGFSEFSPADTVLSGTLADRGKAFGVVSAGIDGNDVAAVWDGVGQAIARARDGEGPSFIVANTFRIHGHVEGEEAFLKTPYRTEEEIDRWRAADPIARFRETHLADAGDEADAIDAEIGALVAAASDKAAEGPWPDPARLKELELGA